MHIGLQGPFGKSAALRAAAPRLPISALSYFLLWASQSHCFLSGPDSALLLEHTG